jgi:hypothetical protein
MKTDKRTNISIKQPNSTPFKELEKRKKNTNFKISRRKDMKIIRDKNETQKRKTIKKINGAMEVLVVFVKKNKTEKPLTRTMK